MAKEPATDDEIYKLCEEIWKVKNSWGFTYWDLIGYSYVKGDLEIEDPKIRAMCPDSPGDTVWIRDDGQSLTRAQCSYWTQHWCTFSFGFITAYRYLERLEP